MKITETESSEFIILSDLCVSYGNKKILENINIKIRRNECICIIGQSGTGKTTLLRSILGLIPYDGKIEIPFRKEGVAYIKQQPFLLPWRDVFQNAALSLEIHNKINDGTLDGLHDKLRDFDMSEYKSYYPSQLSGGMKQRVELIRALACNPALLICDEPFASLDLDARLKLNTLFKQNSSTSQITTVIVTHNIEEALFLGDRIYILGGHPATIKYVHHSFLAEYPEDAVKCRNSDSFQKQYYELWKKLTAVNELKKETY